MQIKGSIPQGVLADGPGMGCTTHLGAKRYLDISSIRGAKAQPWRSSRDLARRFSGERIWEIVRRWEEDSFGKDEG